MTIPQFTDSPADGGGGGQKRDPSEFLNWQRICEMATPRGTRPGKVLIVRPLDKVRDWRDKDPANDWKTLVIADIAVLDPIEPASDEYGMPLPGFPAGSQWRNQTVFPGMLNKAWRDQIGNTLIGVIYLGTNEKGRPPFLWRSLSGLEAATSRGRSFMAARPEFLIPIPRVVEPPVVADQWNQQPQQGWAQPGTQAADPWVSQGQPLHQEWTQPAPVAQPIPQGWGQPAPQQPQYAPQPQMQQQPAQGYAGPVSPAPQGTYQQQPDPWAQQAPQAVSPVQQAPAQHPNQGMSTLEQMKLAAQQRDHQGNVQSGEPPF